MQLTLRPYQRAALDAIQAATTRGVQRQLAVLPTGTGKTIIFSHLIAARQVPTLILVHREELALQTVEKMAMVAPEVRCGIVKADRNELDAPVVVASVQTVQRTARLAPLLPRSLIICDEAHHVDPEGNTWTQILQHCGCWEEGGPTLVGWTATPFRANNKPLVGEGLPFAETVYGLTLAEAITQGYLVGLESKQVYLEHLNLDTVASVGGDWNEHALEEAMLAAKAPEHIVEAWLEHAAQRRTLVFCPGIAMGTQTATLFTQHGIDAACIFGDTPTEARQAIYQRWRSGTIQVVVNCMVLTEGFDEPSVDCIVLARPTRSKVLYTQSIGRGLRLYPGKETCLILDLHGATKRHNLMSVAALYGLLRPPPDDETIGEPEERDGPPAETVQDAESLLLAIEVNLYRKSPLHWITTRRERHVLPLKDGVLRLRCVDTGRDRWIVELKTRAKTVRLASDIPLVYAQGIAEDTVRDQGSEWLSQPNAAWRARQASDKQQAFARRLGLDPSQYAGQGALSDAITAITGDW